MPAETEAEKEELRKLISENQRSIGLIETLMKEHVELMSEQNAKATDILQTEDRANRLKQIVKELREKNDEIRKGGRPVLDGDNLKRPNR